MKKSLVILLIVLTLIAVFLLIKHRFSKQVVDNQSVATSTATDVFTDGAFKIERVYSTDQFGFVADSFPVGNLVYLVGWKGLVIMDVSNPSQPKTLSVYKSPVPFNDIFVSNNHAFVTAGNRENKNGELKIFDVSDSSQVKEIGKYVFPHGSVGVSVIGNTAYVGAYGDGFYLIDVSNPVKPTLISKYFLENPQSYVTTNVPHVWWPEVESPYAFLPYDGAGFHILDLTDPRHPKKISSFNKDDPRGPSDYFFNQVQVVGNYAYISLDYAGLLVLDVSDKTNIKEVKHLDVWPGKNWKTSPGHMIQLQILGDKLFMTAGEDGLYYFDLKDKADPKYLGAFKQADEVGKGCAWGLSSDRNLLFVGYSICKTNYKIKGSFDIFKVAGL